MNSRDMKEAQFERELVEYLSSGTITPVDVNESINAYDNKGQILKTKLWKYEPGIKTTEDLWDNFKSILERLNRDVLRQKPLTLSEFNQVKRIIDNLKTPYQAGQFLYGLHGISQVEIDLEDGRHVYLTVFDQKQIGAGNTVYQVVTQIQRPAKQIGKQDRRFDTTLLINGLPIIQIEEKTDTHDVNEALNQMGQYIEEGQYSDIFSTVQILVGMTPHNAKYMANTTAEMFNTDFAFSWQNEKDNKPVRDWKQFADHFLSIPMAHRMSTNYMILDGTANKQMIKVMRPYQVYATQRALEAVRRADFDLGIEERRLGYIWHTTGSGKTITSFKTAWLASRMGKVDKVVFVVDRIALTRQTSEQYKAYDPTGDVVGGAIQDTESTFDLHRKLKDKSNSIVVTSVQKLGKLVKQKGFKAPDKRILFVVDEAHRSTGGDNFSNIQAAFPQGAWIGYTGTPIFEAQTDKDVKTYDIFGEVLHSYTIREAVADRNVLGFQVDFKTTITKEIVRDEYLPQFYRQQGLSEDEIAVKINNLTDDDMDDQVKPSFYDCNEEHVRWVVNDIIQNWRNRSVNGKYNAMLTTSVGGGRPSTPMALMYFNEFQRRNEERKAQGLPILKVGVTFSLDTSNGDTMTETNKGLHEAIKVYNDMFGQNFGLDTVAEYTQDLMTRVNKTARDKNYLDIVIVVDQLLTGFDAPELNTLYVDRTFRGPLLIQAYSRTNRVRNMQEKQWGRVINYRWPDNNERLMREALALYSNRASADHSTTLIDTNVDVVAPDYAKVLEWVKENVEILRTMTDNFSDIPKSELQQEQMLEELRKYNRNMEALKQYDHKDGDVVKEDIGFDYDDPDALIRAIGMDPDEEMMLTTTLSNKLRNTIADRRKIPPIFIDLTMAHIKDVKVNYDYLTSLIQELIDKTKEKDVEGAKAVEKEIASFADGLEDHEYGKRIKRAAEAIRRGDLTVKGADRLTTDELNNLIEEGNKSVLDRAFLDFRNKWGITEQITNEGLRQLVDRHQYKMKDLDDNQQITNLLKVAVKDYAVLAYDEQVRSLTKMKYRGQLRDAIYEFADELVR